MFLKLNSRGQESAPFELLIAVILMGFVILVGTNAMTELQRQKCHQEIDYKLDEFKEALEIVAKGKGQKNVSFLLEACMSNQKVTLKVSPDPYLCSNFCGGAKTVCTLLQYTARGKNSADAITKCVDISPITEFASVNAPGSCADRSKAPDFLALEDLDEVTNVKQGYYVFTSSFGASTMDAPFVCAYRKVKI